MNKIKVFLNTLGFMIGLGFFIRGVYDNPLLRILGSLFVAISFTFIMDGLTEDKQ